MLFRSGFSRKRLVQSPGDFRGQGSWQEYAQKAGLPKNFEDFGQYFRAITFGGKSAARASGYYNKVLTGSLDNIGDGWFMGRESNDGLFIMARKVRGDVQKAGPQDGWLIFKTDQPGTFVPSQQHWANTIIEKNAWVPPVIMSRDGGPVYDVIAGSIRKLPLYNYAVLPATKEGTARFVDKLLPKDFSRKGNEFLARIKESMREYLAPAGMQFMKNPRANFIHTNARLAYDAAETLAQKVLYGVAKLSADRSLFHSMLRGKAGALDNTASIQSVLEGLSDEEITQLWKVWRQAASGEDLAKLAKSGDISAPVVKAAQELEEIGGAHV